jgi:Uma2 family endonuclease
MAARAPLELDADRIRRLDVDEYHKLIEAGVLGEDEHVELLEGVMLSMPPHGPPHASVVGTLNMLFAVAAGRDRMVRCQLPLTIGDANEPEPDFAIVPAEEGRRRDRHPSTALLVVEVAHSSLRVDRVLKTRLYASAGVPEYWIVDVAREVVEVYRDPDAASGVYRTLNTLGRGDALGTPALPQLNVSVDEVFG